MKNQQLFDETVPVFIHFLGNVGKMLSVGGQYAKKAKGLNEKKVLEGKLAPDMYTLTQQVGYAYFMAFEVVEKLSGKKPPEFTYDERSITELQTSLRRAISFLNTVRPKDYAMGRGGIQTFLSPKRKFSTEEYIRRLALPNFFFHVTTTYDILRHLRVPLTKKKYLGL